MEIREMKNDTGYTEYAEMNQNENRAARRKRRNNKSLARRLRGTAASALVFGLVAGTAFQGVNAVGNLLNPGLGGKNGGETAVTTQNMSLIQSADGATIPGAASSGAVISESSGAAGDMSVSDVAKKVLPATVAINCTGTQIVSTMWGNAQQEYSSCGTGIILGQNEDELLIATNNHVVADSDTVAAEFIDNTSSEAVVKGTDAANDLAVIAVKMSDLSQETKNRIDVAEIGDFDQVAVGEQVVAIGNALGYGQSVTTGIVSALNRQVVTEDTDNNYLLQTDAAINPGNSGGALVNMKGEVIGINSAKATSQHVEGMGYAIPINVASPILTDLMDRQTRTTVEASKSSWLGIAGQDLEEQMASAYNMPVGIYVTEVTQGSPAEQAGLQTGDILVKFDGINVTTISSLKKLMSGYASGEAIEITVKRCIQGEYTDQVLTVKLGHNQE